MQLLFKFVTDTLEVLNLLQRSDHQTQLLILLYSAIDTMAWVGLKENDVTRSDFKTWVDHYLLPGTRLRCNSDDLYSARCGLLHSHTAESSSTSRGKARQIWYYGKGRSADFIAQQIGNRTDIVAVRLLDLILAFSNGAFRFIEELAEDSDNSKKAVERASKWLHWVPSISR
jgi:hypothetical protein